MLHEILSHVKIDELIEERVYKVYIYCHIIANSTSLRLCGVKEMWEESLEQVCMFDFLCWLQSKDSGV
jgi:CRISPR/Cas system-associated endonuclease Cas3-HD